MKWIIIVISLVTISAILKRVFGGLAQDLKYIQGDYHKTSEPVSGPVTDDKTTKL